MRRVVFVGVVGAGLLVAGLGCELIGGVGDLTFVDDQPGGHGGTGAQGGSTAGGGGAGAAGGSTGGGGAQGGGGGQPTCGNSVVDAGEVCFTSPHATYSVGVPTLGDMALIACDGDQDLDVIVTTQGSGSSVEAVFLTNGGDGSLSAGTPAATGLSSPGYIVAANIDGAPGDEVLAAGNTVGFGPVFSSYGANNCQLGSPAFKPGLGGMPTDVGAVRFGGDAKDDMVALVQTSPPQVSYFDSFVAPPQPVGVDAGASSAGSLAVGDLDGNQFTDLVFLAPGSNGVVVRINTGTDFAAASGLAAGTSPAGVALGDLDGVNHDDVVVANSGDDTVSVLLNDGTGGLSLQGSLQVEPSGNLAASKPSAIALADMDADGDLDIVTANTDDSSGHSSVSLFLGDGQGGFVAATTANVPAVAASFPIEVGRKPVAVAVADMNGDGAMDIITASTYASGGSSDVSVLLAVP